MKTNEQTITNSSGHVPELLRVAVAILEQPLEFPPDDEAGEEHEAQDAANDSDGE